MLHLCSVVGSAQDPSELAPVSTEASRFARLCAAGALAYCSYAMCRTPVLPLFASALGAGPRQVGVVVAAS
ncbi:MAG: hypothetical protein HYS05_18980, partial [Acidobacteria bacterium]|nr:hypothetical protein [Acidobacteriota bacterium]